MIDYKAQSIPSDIERKKILNQEFNSRKEIPNEATNSINPITGRKYNYLSNISSKLDFVPLKTYLFDISSSFSNNYLKHLIIKEEKFPKPTTNNFIEYQFVLARMDIADEKMVDSQYTNTKRIIKNLVERMNENKVPLALISNPNSLNDALNELEQEELLIYNFPPGILNSNYNKKNPDNILSGIFEKYSAATATA